jgi:mannosyltransferase
MLPIKIVLDNIIYSKEKQGGISNYWYEISSALLRDPSVAPFFVDAKDAEFNCCWQRLKVPERQRIISQQNSSAFLARLSPVNIPIDGSCLYHSSFYRRPIGKGQITEITTVHDFTHNYYAPWHKRLIHNNLKYQAINRSQGVICVSNNTLNDLNKFCNIKGKEVAVIHNGVSDSYFEKPNLSKDDIDFLTSLNITDGRFLLFVGSRARYKNFDFLLQLLLELPDYKLVVVGSTFDKNEINDLRIKNLLNRVINTNNIENSRLNTLYNAAHCLVYPSFYEGFGIPVAEAMKTGCPVLALNRSSLPEVAGGAAVLFDDLNLEEFKAGIKKLENEDHRAEAKQRGLIQGGKFSWKNCTQQTIDFYKQVYSRNA